MKPLGWLTKGKYDTGLHHNQTVLELNNWIIAAISGSRSRELKVDYPNKKEKRSITFAFRNLM